MNQPALTRQVFKKLLCYDKPATAEELAAAIDQKVAPTRLALEHLQQQGTLQQLADGWLVANFTAET